jgi:UDP-2-acetamido-3-amino-2,3-dideoxy-glucuronate N-acetyltransferase
MGEGKIIRLPDMVTIDGVWIHETAIVESEYIGEGTKIWAYSHISKGVQIGKNCVIGEGVHIGPGVEIGDGCKIQNHSILYEGVRIEDNVFIGPNTVTTNDLYPKADGRWTKKNFRETVIRTGASIGANTTIVCGVKIGNNSLIGAGSVVTKDIPDGYLAFGSPATIKRRMK